jgi:hypothetical protein
MRMREARATDFVASNKLHRLHSNQSNQRNKSSSWIFVSVLESRYLMITGV